MRRIAAAFFFLGFALGCDPIPNVIRTSSAYSGPVAIAIQHSFRDDYEIGGGDERTFELGDEPILCVSDVEVVVPNPNLVLAAPPQEEAMPGETKPSDPLPDRHVAIYGQSLAGPSRVQIVWVGVGDSDLHEQLQKEFYAGTLYRRLDRYWKPKAPESVADHLRVAEFHEYIGSYCRTGDA